MQKQISAVLLFSISHLDLGFKHIKTPVIVFFRLLSQIGRNLQIFFFYNPHHIKLKPLKHRPAHVDDIVEWIDECKNQGFS